MKNERAEKSKHDLVFQSLIEPKKPKPPAPEPTISLKSKKREIREQQMNFFKKFGITPNNNNMTIINEEVTVEEDEPQYQKVDYLVKVDKIKKKKGKKGKKKSKAIKVEFSLDDPVEEDDGAEQAKKDVQINLQSGVKDLVNKAQ